MRSKQHSNALKSQLRPTAALPSVDAGVAQLVEQRIRNAKVGSSTLLTGTNEFKGPPVSGPSAFWAAFAAHAAHLAI
jgi:hypothetical protein